MFTWEAETKQILTFSPKKPEQLMPYDCNNELANFSIMSD